MSTGAAFASPDWADALTRAGIPSRKDAHKDEEVGNLKAPESEDLS